MTTPTRIRAVVKEPGMQPRIVELRPKEPFDHVAELIKAPNEKGVGFVQIVHFDEIIDIAVNEDGIRFNLPRNFLFHSERTGDVQFLGTAVFIRWWGEEIADLTDQQIARVITFFAGRDDLRKRNNPDRCFHCDQELDGTPHACPVTGTTIG